MQHILKRIAAKIKQADIDQESFGRFCIEHELDPDIYGGIVPRLPEDEVYDKVYRFIGHPDAMFPDGGGLTEKITKWQKPEDRLLWSDMHDTDHTAQITAKDIPKVLDEFGDSLKVLSLDCFDTLLWRQTATPRDVFAVLADTPIARRLGVTPHQRISAAARARRAKLLENGSREIDIGDIYRSFTSLSSEERELLAEAEIRTEVSVCFAFSPYVELIRLAHTRGIKIIVVSDTYFRQDELRRLLARHLPVDVMQAISKVYCSVDYGTSKSDALFQVVIRECGVPASHLLHIGDDGVADAQAPRKLGVQALHFVPFDREVAEFLRLQRAASSLIVLEQAAPAAVILPCYSPFRPVFSVANLHQYTPETLIGYMSFGPALYAYARFLMDEVEALQQQGKRVKVFFLLRDAYLLSAACEAYARKPVGKLVRIRKFHAIAASFKTRADIDHYISGIEPECNTLHAIAKQLLLPPKLTELLIRVAHQSDDPKTAFHQLLHEEDVLELIFKNSFTLRARLKRYISRELAPEEGDTIVLADIGYNGRTQEYLSRTFKDEFNIDILGRYVFSSDEPYRSANSKALITSTWDNTTIFEQCCTLKEGAVVNYEFDGEPIITDIVLSEKQYEKIAKVHAECLRFIDDARAFFTTSDLTHEYSMLQGAAHAALFRNAYMPVEAELEYLKDFQHDKFMGPDRKKTIYHLESAWNNVRRLPSPYRLGAYETRGLGLDFTFSGLLQRRFQLDLGPDDMNVRFSPLKVLIGSTHDTKAFLLRAHHLHDGYFSIMLPYVSGTSVKMLFGEHYEWLQIADIQLLNNAGRVCRNVSCSLSLEEINREGEIYQCLSQASVATIRPSDLQQLKTPHYFHVIFRPLVSRASDSAAETRPAAIKEENSCGPRDGDSLARKGFGG
ncbi:HAD family hydrolase [Mesorhizobium sp. M0496]|uniref:HAD family hydrolase n=1 Tax=Mesorhizobium sp. M0496 TaxID=2956952 RepID=UPI0033387120